MDRVEVNRGIIDEFRANHGVVASFGGVPLLLLTTTGARSGEPRTSPMMCVRDGDDLVVFGTNGGRDVDPSWVHNLRADPHGTAEVGDQRFAVVASFAVGEERDRLWRAGIDQNPMFADFATRTERAIPIVVLRRASS